MSLFSRAHHEHGDEHEAGGEELHADQETGDPTRAATGATRLDRKRRTYPLRWRAPDTGRPATVTAARTQQATIQNCGEVAPNRSMSSAAASGPASTSRRVAATASISSKAERSQQEGFEEVLRDEVAPRGADDATHRSFLHANHGLGGGEVRVVECGDEDDEDAERIEQSRHRQTRIRCIEDPVQAYELDLRHRAGCENQLHVGTMLLGDAREAAIDGCAGDRAILRQQDVRVIPGESGRPVQPDCCHLRRLLRDRGFVHVHRNERLEVERCIPVARLDMCEGCTRRGHHAGHGNRVSAVHQERAPDYVGGAIQLTSEVLREHDAARARERISALTGNEVEVEDPGEVGIGVGSADRVRLPLDRE